MLLKEEVVHSLLLEQIPRQFVHNVHLVVLVLDLAQFLQCDFVLMQMSKKEASLMITCLSSATTSIDFTIDLKSSSLMV